MKPLKTVAILLLVGGILALVYGGFSYTEEQHDLDIGPVELQVKDKERVSIPTWLGVGAIVIGTGLLLVPGKSAS